jgi:hypothetical protein
MLDVEIFCLKVVVNLVTEILLDNIKVKALKWILLLALSATLVTPT